LRVAQVGHAAELHKRTLQRGLLSLIGPKARAIAQVDDLAGKEFKNAPFTVNGVPAHAIITEFGVDVHCAAEDTDRIAATLRERGATAITETECEVARIAKGRPRFGVELDERTMPQEAGLTDRAVSFTKGCYVGQETVARLYYRGKPNRHLRGLRFDDEPSGDGAVGFADKEVGRVRRVARSPKVGTVALALLRREVEPGATVECGGTTATVVELPFPMRAAPAPGCDDAPTPA
ncbi:MAG: folate-binding protein, partial [Patulibacter sp.]|nr:folate-binding protein [Patulibacter sp.]